MLNDIKEIYFSKEQLKEITDRIGAQISRDFEGKDLILISVLKGSVIFMADLMRSITIPCRIDFITAQSYGQSMTSSGNVSITKDISDNIEGCDILLVEDIFDSGNTLQRLSDYLATRNPSSITLCTLLDKPKRRDPNVKLVPKYIGAEVEDQFVVGYGLDYNQKYRNLPFIGILKPEIYNAKQHLFNQETKERV